MSYSANTGKLGLPQWVKGTKDHPDFLTDMNQAFEKIDRFAERTDNTVDGLPEQVDELAALVESMQEDVGEHTTELASLGVRVGILESKQNTTETSIENINERLGTALDSINALLLTDAQLGVMVNTIQDTITIEGVDLTVNLSRNGLLVGIWIDARDLMKLNGTVTYGKYYDVSLGNSIDSRLSIPENWSANISGRYDSHSPNGELVAAAHINMNPETRNFDISVKLWREVPDGSTAVVAYLEMWRWKQ